MKVVRRFLVAAVCASTLVGAGASPASAGAATPGIAFDITSSGLYHVVSACHLVLAYTTDPRFVTYVVRASADAEGPSVALATGVMCTVYSGGVPRGGASGSLIGLHAEAVGQAIVPVGQLPVLCVSGGATFLSGSTVSQKPCP